MRLTTLTIAASLALAFTGAATAQGIPGGGGSGGNVQSEPDKGTATGGAMSKDGMNKGGASGTMNKSDGMSDTTGSTGNMRSGAGTGGTQPTPAEPTPSR